MKGSRVVIAAGVGDFGSFRNSVEQLGCRIEKSFEFQDHHWYTEWDLDRMRDDFRNRETDYLITTGKDSVRMRSMGTSYERFLGDVPVAVLEIVPRFIEGEEVVDELIEGIFR
jgi:tetraacyldisaccharide 4'-kinase